MRNLIFIGLFMSLTSCQNDLKNELSEGIYRATLEVQDSEVLPFNFEVLADKTLNMFNAEEVINVDEIEYRNDSIFIRFPVYEGYFAAVFDGKDLRGNYIKESLERVVPFYAEYGNKTRFSDSEGPSEDATGVWEAVFSKGIKGDEYIAKGIFKQVDGKVTGTFRTTTGDYRYLEGHMDGNKMRLSAFDGAHAFLFIATVTDSIMRGQFYSGNHWKEPFEAIRNDGYELPHADNLTFLKDGYDRFDFSFPNSEGKMISLDDKQFEDKVVIVQIMGTWCPNCLDESRYYSTYVKQNKNKDLAFVALAFEYAKTKEKAFEGIARLKERLNIPYPILLAQVGTSSKTEAQKKLPMLNHVLSYPTTIFIDKKGEVRKIHTGFNGPATGEKYITFQKEFDAFVKSLLNE
ncbi:MAG: TlpA family protein disulfide reductase [Bacteroidia bacterium]|nr:TlpA family protein disulfide reductase [Bacteroidia bacterium]RZW43316.1 MAG: TlpA family protein disulfide reductase [Flavobacteriaceae bacterium]